MIEFTATIISYRYDGSVARSSRTTLVSLLMVCFVLALGPFCDLLACHESKWLYYAFMATTRSRVRRFLNLNNGNRGVAGQRCFSPMRKPAGSLWHRANNLGRRAHLFTGQHIAVHPPWFWISTTSRLETPSSAFNSTTAQKIHASAQTSATIAGRSGIFVRCDKTEVLCFIQHFF